jgi:hypothetical protein
MLPLFLECTDFWPLALLTTANAFMLFERGNVSEPLDVWLAVETLWSEKFSVEHRMKFIETSFHVFQTLGMSLEVFGPPECIYEMKTRTWVGMIFTLRKKVRKNWIW